uniref:Large ribosomal subunit protein uL10 n=1 Tax=Thermofilum pendens TaxID=2269 RepID=A0A7C1T137_THEPE
MSGQVTVVVRERLSPARQRKLRMLQELKELLTENKYFLVADIHGLPTSVVKGTRSLLRERNGYLKVVKNKVFLLALKEAGRYAEGIERVLQGQNAVIFTNDNPFSVVLFLEKQRITREARAGDIATNEIVIPSGNTGIPPGPVLSLFSKLNIPTRIQEGSIFVVKDTVVAKPGDRISPELAELLNKLGLKPIESKLRVKALCIDHRVVSPDEVELDPKVYAEKLKQAYAEALNLAVNAVLPAPEVVELAVRRAHAEALALALEAAIPTPEAAPLLLQKAEAAARALYEVLKRKNPSL